MSSLKGLRQTLLREELVSRLRITTIPKNNTSFEICACVRIDTQQSQSNELNEHCRYIHNLPLKIIIINTRLCAAQCEGGGGVAGELNEYINNLLNYKNVFWVARSTWTSTGAGTGAGADFGHNALNYGLIVHATCCHSYVARRGSEEWGNWNWHSNGNGTQSRGDNRAKFAPHFVG